MNFGNLWKNLSVISPFFARKLLRRVPSKEWLPIYIYISLSSYSDLYYHFFLIFTIIFSDLYYILSFLIFSDLFSSSFRVFPIFLTIIIIIIIIINAILSILSIIIITNIMPSLFIIDILPSGNRLHSYGKIHHFSWENPLFLWSFSIAM